ncbi:MAG: EAL domain-containing protein [Chroococcus sp. CMT-3BRIN-NPC107]|jgi:diguanylate cyclase (GGDEF)-like protein/PAS domain S-box-containing protein|nr:EAL domain-containing protein [Chroococcus sp. CMT-3BRIN-NPC107]
MPNDQIIQVSQALKVSYDWRLVVLSLVIATVSSYTALDLARQVALASGRASKLWLLGAAIALGISVWLMHFIAMLAYDLPIPVNYNFYIVFLSMVVAIACCGIGLLFVTKQPLNWLRFLAGGSFVGLGVIGMHFTAMTGMQLAAVPVYDLKIVALANLSTFILGFSALGLAFHPIADKVPENIRKLGSAVLTGLAIDSLHYTAVAAVKFYPSFKLLKEQPPGNDDYVLALSISIAALIILALASLASSFGQRLSAEIAKAEALQESEELYQSLYDFAPDAYLIVTGDGKIKSINQYGAEVLGYSKQELIYRDFSTIIYESDRDYFQQLFASIFKEKLAIVEAEFRKVRKDGSIIWERQRSQLIFNNDGEPIELRMICRDITEIKQVEEQLRQNAFYDSLTGLPNRVLFIERLEQAIGHNQRHKEHLFAVLFLDLDRFKVVNDSLGHLMGDRLLIELARRLKLCLRQSDTVARIGGDEFTILLADIKDSSDAVRVVERIQEQLQLPFTLNANEVFTSVSIGITLSNTGYNYAEDVLRDADIAMYRAKIQGTARYEIFNADMHAQAVTLLQLETDLRLAIERQEFRLQYQPIVLLESGKIAGFEALIRWQHPQRGLLSPDKFLPTAIETGLLISICQWVIRTACQQAKQWRAQFPDLLLTISINLSSPRFNQSNLSKEVAGVLHDTDLDASILKLEITENLIMTSAEKVTAMLYELKDLGIQLSIDDFGTGYSSLARLHDFPIDELKIDRFFIDSMNSNSGNSQIVEAIIALGQKLNLDVTAEGVETPKQLAKLRELKCKYGQGFFFSRPLDSEAVRELLLTNPQW